MAKLIDKAGMWKVKRNPLTKEGVYPYSGKVIDPTGKEYGLSPDKFYLVYRPFSEISSDSFMSSLDGKPIIEGHTMLGTPDKGLVPADNVNTLGSVSPVEAKDGTVYGDLTIWSEHMKKLIQEGKKELSLGYTAKYRKESGTWNGMEYDFVQHGLEANHVALVAHGRMGSDVRVYDSITFDSVEVEKMNIREEITELLKGASDEDLAKVKDSISDLLNGEGKDEDEEKKDEDKTDSEDEDEDKSDDDKTDSEDEDEEKSDDDDSDSEDEDEEGEPKEKTPPTADCGKKTGDSAPTMKEVMKAIAARDSLYSEVSKIPEVGTFDHAEMMEEDVASYAAGKLGFKNKSVDFMKGYLANRQSKKSESRFTGDSSEEATNSGTIDKYLNS